MLRYPNNLICFSAALFLLTVPIFAFAQRADNDRPISLIDNAPVPNTETLTDDIVVQTRGHPLGDGQVDPMAADQPRNIPSNDDSLSDTSLAYAQVKLGRRKISEVGLAAIGVGDADTEELGLDSMIWRGTSATDAVFLLEKAAVVSHSEALTDLSYRVVAKQSVPPSGANLVAVELVAARLAWLARAGRSNDLAILANQLPESPNWANWKRWLV